MSLSMLKTISIISMFTIESLFCSKYLEKKKSSFFTFSVSLATWCILGFFAESHGYLIVRIFFPFLCPLISSYIASTRSIKGCIRFSVFCYLMHLFIEFIGQIFYVYLGQMPITSLNLLSQAPLDASDFVLVTAKTFGVLLFYVTYTSAYILLKHKESKIKIFFLTITLLFFLSQFSTIYIYFSVNYTNLTIAMIIYNSLSCFIVLFTYIAIYELAERLFTQQLKQQQLEYQLLEKSLNYNYYKMAEASVDDVILIKKNLTEELTTALQLIENNTFEHNNEVQLILTQMKQHISSIRSVTYCNIPLLNVILSIKSAEAQKKNIKLEITVGKIHKPAISDIDLCCILTNLLDNALLYCDVTVKCPLVTIRLLEKAGYLLIITQNPAFQMPKKDLGGHYITSHSDPVNHGYGLSIIEKTAKKYDGYTKFHYKDGFFTASVFLMLNQ